MNFLINGMKQSFNMYNFENKNVLVTGGSTGIGAEIVRQFFLAGANIYVISRSKKKLNEISASLKTLNTKGGFTMFPLDVTDLKAFKNYLNTENTNGISFDVMVNSAGIYPKIKLIDTKEEDWDKIINVNLRSAFFISKYMARHMMATGGGSIINIASFAAEVPSVGSGVYAASKAGLNSLVKSMASEWAPYNIRVNALNPGVIRTEMTQKLINKKGEDMLKQIALNRFGNPSEVAETVLFIASEASSYITGEIINVTGGKLITQDPRQAWETE